jgi:hypothetical protein
VIHVLYRLTTTENTQDRPVWYSKRDCFRSLVAAMTTGKTTGMTLKVFLHKGPCEWLYDTVVQEIDTKDMAETCVLVYHEAIKLPDEDWVYFSEDDYMHKPDSLVKLQHCIEDVKPDIISLYDHPDRYRDRPEHNFTNGKNDIYISRDHHWRTIPSTCMTYGISVKCLKENQDLFEEHKHVDFNLFPAILGYKGERPNKYLMVGAIPSLATHCMTEHLAPFWSNQ